MGVFLDSEYGGSLFFIPYEGSRVNDSFDFTRRIPKFSTALTASLSTAMTRYCWL